MIEPVLVLRMMLRTMAATPGRDQSRGSTDQSSGVIPACAHSLRTTGDQAPYGARNRAGTVPVALWIAQVARPIWSATAAGGRYTRSRWDQVWCGCVGMPGGILPVPGQQRHSPDDQNRPARCLPRAHLPAPRCSSPPNRPFAYEDEDCTVMTPVVLNTLG